MIRLRSSATPPSLAAWAEARSLPPGDRKFSITLPGYNTFNTEIDLAPNQKFVLKTDLTKSGSPAMQEPKLGGGLISWSGPAKTTKAIAS
jgi:hypothetical protein